jgi:hypothetical protein
MQQKIDQLLENQKYYLDKISKYLSLDHIENSKDTLEITSQVFRDFEVLNDKNFIISKDTSFSVYFKNKDTEYIILLFRFLLFLGSCTLQKIL